MPFQPGRSGNPPTQFRPGQSGNPSGRPKRQSATALLREATEAGMLVKVCGPNAADLSRAELHDALARLLA